MVKRIMFICTCVLLFSIVGTSRARAADDWATNDVSVRAVANETGFSVIGLRGNLFLRVNENTILHFATERAYAVQLYVDGTRLPLRFANDAAPILRDGEMYINAYTLAQMLGLVFVNTRFHRQDTAAEARYLYNKTIVAALDSGSFIFGQNSNPIRNMRIGLRGDMGRHGCGPVAVHNALLYLYNNHPTQQTVAPNIAGIIRYLDYNGGMNLNGLAGTHPEVLTAYLQHAGHTAQLVYEPTNLDTRVRDATISILLYGQIRGGAFVHYVKIRHDAGYFWVYNEFGNDTQARVYDSLDAWVAERGYRVVALITV